MMTKDFEGTNDMVSKEYVASAKEPSTEATLSDSGSEQVGAVGPKGIWGWNTIPILNLIAMAGMAFYASFSQGFPLFLNGTMWAFWTKGCEAYNPNLGLLISAELAFQLVLATVSVYALILVAKRSSSYPGLTFVLFCTAAIGGVVELIIMHNLNLETTSEQVMDACRTAGFAVIWRTYFSMSMRIKNTFVNASASWRKICCAVFIVLAVSALFCLVGMRSNVPAQRSVTSNAYAVDETGHL